MCQICDAWKSKKIDAKEAFRRIKKEMGSDEGACLHLMDLSDEILNQEVPFTETDPESEPYVDGNTDWSS